MLNIKHLYFSYDNSSPCILNNINIDIKDGEYVSIIGDNGSGKSTLIKIILGFLKPTKGELDIGFNRIGYVSQKQDGFNAQFPMSVHEMLDCHRKVLKIKDHNVINESLNMVKMNDFEHDLVGNLSGGQRQKIFIARALIGNPDLLIFDEPSTGIDVTSQDEIYGFIKDLNTNTGITVISVEHNIEAAISNSSFIYKIQDCNGYIIEENKFFMLKKEGSLYASV